MPSSNSGDVVVVIRRRVARAELDLVLLGVSGLGGLGAVPAVSVPAGPVDVLVGLVDVLVGLVDVLQADPGLHHGGRCHRGR